MAIGERIHHFRLLRGFTQKYLGQQLGFSDSQADVRIAQYEKGARSPKEKYLNALADIFEVSPHALAVPDIDSYVGLMHTLFTLEDLTDFTLMRLTENSASGWTSPREPPTFLCLICSMHGRNRQKNSNPARLLRKNMTSGVTTIQKTQNKSRRKRPYQIDFTQFSKTFFVGFTHITR